ncbi:MAG: hypothetical protein ACXWLH_04230 [Candidatus Saccharimonadales bacterium]
MALATRPKPKVHHRKRQAHHHKKTHHYLKTYWPYLPAFAILGVGTLLNNWLYSSDWMAEKAVSNVNGFGSGTRIEALVAGNPSAALLTVIVVAAFAMVYFLFRNWFRIQRTLNRGEMFMVKHPWVDVGLILILTASVILTRQVI